MGAMDPVDIASILVLAVAFLGAAGTAVAEVSLLRVRRSQVAVAADEGDSGARRLLSLIDDLPIVLPTVLLMALLLQVSAATAAGFLAQRWFGDVGVTAATVATTVVLFLYAEAIPKTMAIRTPERMARLVTPVVAGVVVVARPAVRFLVWLADKQTPGSDDAGVIGESDAELLERSFEFNDRRVAEVMVDRADIAWASATTTLRSARELAVAAGHRRLPVCRAGIDDVVGVARFRDVVAAATDEPDAPLSSVTTDVLRCPPDQLISSLVTRMQDRGRWLAIVTDPAGRTLGLVTIEDLVAELVGEISDEAPARPSRPGRRRR